MFESKPRGLLVIRIVSIDFEEILDNTQVHDKEYLIRFHVLENFSNGV
jgi:hypothetical protein